MNKNKLRQVLYFIHIAFFIFLTSFWLSGGDFSTASAFTVPTRTPVPGGGGGNGGGGGSGGGSGGGESQPTAEPPTLTPTATTVPVTIAPTPIDGFITPEACGIPLFQAANGTVNVRSLPAADSALFSQLVYLESRGIIGRFATGEWWLIVLADGSQGWVADASGTVFGNTSAVPALDEDKIPVNEASWLPTPDPACPTLTPTTVPTATSTPEPTATATATQPKSSESQSTTSGTESEVESQTAQNQSEGTESESQSAPSENTDADQEQAAATEPPTATPISEPTVASTDSVEVVTADLDQTPPSTGGSMIFWIGGIGLLLAGLVAFVVQRR